MATKSLQRKFRSVMDEVHKQLERKILRAEDKQVELELEFIEEERRRK